MSFLQSGAVYVAFAMLLAANGSPIIADRLLGSRFAWPIDSGRRWHDGRAILGFTKTWRGLLSAVGGTALVAGLFGKPLALGAIFGALSMTGDLISSFVKRRMGLQSSKSAFGLDHIPEALLPTACLAGMIGLTLWDVAGVTFGFLVLGIGLSKILHLLRIRSQPLQ